MSALVFDFDGTILDTETPVYESWADTYLMAGAEPVSLERWLRKTLARPTVSGWIFALSCAASLASTRCPPRWKRRRKSLCDEMIQAQPLRDGVEEWIDAAAALGTGLGGCIEFTNDLGQRTS